jgi:HK97 family phage portal protein
MFKWLEALRSYVLGPFKLSEIDRLLLGGRTTASGVDVSEQTALNLSAVWNAVQMIAGTVGSLPLILYRRLPEGGRERYYDHPLYRILHDEPNDEMTSMVFRETLMGHALLWGNAYAEIQRDVTNRPRALHVITPDRVQVKRRRNGTLYYEVFNPDRGPSELEPRDILHVPNMSPDGTQGYSVIGKARETLGIGLAAERYGAALFGNGLRFGGILTTPKRMLPETKEKLRAELENLHRGSDRAHKLAILEEDLTWTATSMPPDDAQFLETRKFQVTEVARWFNIPVHKIKDMERATFTNIEHQGIEFVTDTLRPWLIRWEQEVNRKLIAPLERKSQYVEHLVDALLRGDTLARQQALEVRFRNGTLSQDEWREIENANPLAEGSGKSYYIPMNYMPSSPVPAISDRADTVGVLVRAGFDPAESLKAVDLPPIKHLGVPPITVQKEEEPGGGDPNPVPPPLRTAAALPSESVRGLSPQVIAAQRVMLADAVRRNLAREKDKARATATHGPERLRAWVGEFYAGPYVDAFRRALLPPIQLHVALTESDRDPDQVARDFVDAHVIESRRQFHALLDNPSTDVLGAVEELMARWDIERVNTIPDAVMAEELAHHGR